MAKEGYFSKGFLTRLRENEAGNTLALVAAGVFPLLGLIGGGVDMSRLYLTKSRLQQACDAGALSGRKMMGSGSWADNSYKARTTAENMFAANFQSGAYGTNTVSRAYTESGGNVSGTASVQVPMTIMKVFGQGTKTVAVSCDAAMRIPNTDVMFVLDTTGSMGSKAVSTDSVTKIEGLKVAVKCFYEALAKVDIDDVTNAQCGNSATPSGGNGAGVQLRFGFVPYATNANVGKLFKNEWMADSAPYQSRTWGTNIQIPYIYDTGGWSYLSGSSVTTNEKNKSSCPSSTKSTATGNSSVLSSSTAGDGTVTTTIQETQVTNGYWISNCSGSGNKQSYDKNTYTNYAEKRTVTIKTKKGNGWTYAQRTITVSALKNGGSNWKTTVSVPLLGNNGANTSVTWDGCVEDMKPHRNTDGDPSDEYWPIPADAYDMEIDKIPTAGDVDTQWKPILNAAVWGRYNPLVSDSAWSYDPIVSDGSLSRNTSYSCPVAARKLAEYKASQTDNNYKPSGFKSYVNSLSASGNTYHDVGLIWGARLMSATGLFASENATSSNGGAIERHLIFMTDGDTVTNNQGYTSHGIAWWDRRQTSLTTGPTNALLDSTVNARFLALCSAIKGKGITLWVISFGSGVTSTAAQNLQKCASTDRFFTASSSTTLIDQFRAIADQISQLRLTS
jgi:Flp pilus assembly protein TadG